MDDGITRIDGLAKSINACENLKKKGLITLNNFIPQIFTSDIIDLMYKESVGVNHQVKFLNQSLWSTKN